MNYEKLRKGLKTTSQVVSTIFNLGLVSLTAFDFKSQVLAPRINTQEELAKVIELEKRKLGLEKASILGKLVGENDENISWWARGGACEDSNGGYIIFFEKKYATTDLIKHELWHIAAGDTRALKPEDINPPLESLVGRVFGNIAKTNYWNWYKDLLYTLGYLSKGEPAAIVYGATEFRTRPTIANH